MPIYEIMADRMKALETTTFSEARIQERSDLQRLLREDVRVIDPNIMVISEEFSSWADSSRRIDLLCLDTNANLVVMELKRGEGAHMELQALRYAAMISAMTYEKVLSAHTHYLIKRSPGMNPQEAETQANEAILGFLGWSEFLPEEFAQDVRIVLVSEEFHTELTTAVLWLRERNVDIRCVRMKPYRTDDARLMVDVQSIIPLPEANEYQVQWKEKAQQVRQATAEGKGGTRYNITAGDQDFLGLPKNRAILRIVKLLCESGIPMEQVSQVIGPRMVFPVLGEVDSAEFLARARQQQEDAGKRFDSVRWFLADDELVHAVGKTYAVSTQWGKNGELVMQRLLDEFPERFTFEVI